MKKKTVSLDRHGRRTAKKRRRNPAYEIDFSKIDLIRLGTAMENAGRVLRIFGEIFQVKTSESPTDAKKNSNSH